MVGFRPTKCITNVYKHDNSARFKLLEILICGINSEEMTSHDVSTHKNTHSIANLSF